jgi:hypothetical protein
VFSVKAQAIADSIGVALLATIATVPLSCSGRVTPMRENLQPLVAAAGAYSVRETKPPPPPSGCEKGCQCNGTGREKSGDGLAVIPCRCEDTCVCKAPKEARAGWPKRNMPH